jgi:cobalt-zinc-cadmium efflux system protein
LKPDHAHEDADHSGHNHGPVGHAHAPSSFGRAFAIGIGLNIAFVIVEAVYGVLSNSVALLADAGHNLSDVLGLVVAWLAVILSKRAPTRTFTYGFGASSILAALFNAVFLLIAVGAITWEAVQRLFAPQEVAGTTVMIVAAIGFLHQWCDRMAGLPLAERAISTFVAHTCTWQRTPECRWASW